MASFLHYYQIGVATNQYWKGINELYPPDGVTAGGALTQTVYEGIVTQYGTDMDACTAAETGESAAWDALQAGCDILHGYVVAYRWAVEDLLPGSPLIKSIPAVGGPGRGVDNLLRGSSATLAHWALADEASEPDITVAGGKTRAQVKTQHDLVVSLREEAVRKKAVRQAAQATRNNSKGVLVGATEHFHAAAKRRLTGTYDELLAQMPVLFPRSAAGPQDEIELTGTVDAEGRAHLGFTQSQDDNFACYHVRARQGTAAPTATDTLLATITERTQTTLVANVMFNPGAPVWSFRVWVQDDNGRVCSSNALTLTRPA